MRGLFLTIRNKFQAASIYLSQICIQNIVLKSIRSYSLQFSVGKTKSQKKGWNENSICSDQLSWINNDCLWKRTKYRSGFFGLQQIMWPGKRESPADQFGAKTMQWIRFLNTLQQFLRVYVLLVNYSWSQECDPHSCILFGTTLGVSQDTYIRASNPSDAWYYQTSPIYVSASDICYSYSRIALDGLPGIKKLFDQLSF